MKAVNNAQQEEKANSLAFYLFSGLMVVGFLALIGAVIYLYVG